MKLILSTLIFMSFLGTVTAQTSDEAAVTKAVEVLCQEMIKPDKAGLEQITSAKLVYGHSDGQKQNQSQLISSLVTGASDFVTIDLTEQSVIVVGQAAVVRHLLTADTNDGGKPGKVKLVVMLTWAKDGGQWKLIGRQAVRPKN